MGEDFKEEQLESLYRQLTDKIKPTFKNVKDSYIDFKKSIDAWRNSPIEERPHHLADADRHSKEAVKLLKEIINIAKRTDNPDLIKYMEIFIIHIQQERQKIGLNLVRI